MCRLAAWASSAPTTLDTVLGPGSLAGAMDRLLERMDEVGLTSWSLNAVLLEPATLRVVSCHDPDTRLSAARIWPAGREDAVWPSYFPLSFQEQPDLCAAASSGIV